MGSETTSTARGRTVVDARVADLGARLRGRRLDLGHTQADLAELTGLTRGTINRLERGSTDISVGRLLRICDALGCALSELVTAVDE
ncbi:helix-turn-helix domain-containing protein [Nocardioides rubriscoriae]|uniref:helix-turn-helix domain-containing protein n=1 Tax=Nocardioides rubriscoriae TaxID=642762 RepID=UPI0014796930